MAERILLGEDCAIAPRMPCAGGRGGTPTPPQSRSLRRALQAQVRCCGRFPVCVGRFPDEALAPASPWGPQTSVASSQGLLSPLTSRLSAAVKPLCNLSASAGPLEASWSKAPVLVAPAWVETWPGHLLRDLATLPLGGGRRREMPSTARSAPCLRGRPLDLRSQALDGAAPPPPHPHSQKGFLGPVSPVKFPLGSLRSLSQQLSTHSPSAA